MNRLFIICLLQLCALTKALATANSWLDLLHGTLVDQQEVLSDLSRSRIIYLGEVHTLKSHHKAQLDILRLLNKRHVPLALALESLEAKDQAYINRFIQGQLSFDQFSAMISWQKKWPNYLDYRPLCLFAQKHHIPIIGIDISHSIASRIAKYGYSSLTEKEKELYPLTSLSSLYRNFLSPFLSVHSFMDNKRIAYAIEAQRVREAFMAKQITNFLQSPLGIKRTVCVITGEIHIRYGLGIPQLCQRYPQRIILFGSKEPIKLTAKEIQMSKKVSIAHKQFSFIRSPVADYFELLEK
ncbi:ChaN family lipoprotein [Methylacidiphilum caldifontis]|uniref:ChaN family lipoprotein n=1 Tax=Methylacidiphilum caldifontis TaxID=2795386 RepID=UPI001069B68F|nr:ChaN family lipoprotein [Methylacidiphilum caldifontis]